MKTLWIMYKQGLEEKPTIQMRGIGGCKKLTVVILRNEVRGTKWLDFSEYFEENEPKITI